MKLQIEVYTRIAHDTFIINKELTSSDDPLRDREKARGFAEKYIAEGFWDGDTLFPPHRVANIAVLP